MANNEHQTFDLHEAADFLKMHWQTLREKAVSGEIPAAKPAKQWVFYKKTLFLTFVRNILNLGWGCKYNRLEEVLYVVQAT